MNFSHFSTDFVMNISHNIVNLPMLLNHSGGTVLGLSQTTSILSKLQKLQNSSEEHT